MDQPTQLFRVIWHIHIIVTVFKLHQHLSQSLFLAFVTFGAGDPADVINTSFHLFTTKNRNEWARCSVASD
jgi:hypothetical protein